MSDNELLEDFLRTGSEAAFADLVKRHLGLVYSTAVRLTKNHHHAQEITQVVFVILARKAAVLPKETILSGWLYQTARLTAANFLRSETRRQQREQEVYFQSTSNEPATAEWAEIEPFLDEAMGELGDVDRTAVILRFFENKSVQEIAQALNVKQAAAHKRVTRAVEKLQNIFSKKGVTVTTTILAAIVSTNSIQAAPAGLESAIAAAALNGSVAASTSVLLHATLKTIPGSIAKTTLTTLSTMLLSPILSAAGSYYFGKRAADRSKSEEERAARIRFAWKIGVTNVVMALTGVPSLLISPVEHPWRFGASILLVLGGVIVCVGLQIRWSFRHREELKEIPALKHP